MPVAQRRVGDAADGPSCVPVVENVNVGVGDVEIVVLGIAVQIPGVGQGATVRVTRTPSVERYGQGRGPEVGVATIEGDGRLVAGADVIRWTAPPSKST